MKRPADHEAERQLQGFMTGLERRNPHEPEFRQAVREVVETLLPFVLAHPEYTRGRILERLTEPDRILTFRVCWEDDAGNVRVNRAWRVQFNNSLGPYKGGMRFRKDLTLSVLKCLGFDQVFKNALTGLPMGGGKGGADFNPRGKSDREVMRFCQSLMSELHRHIGEYTDVPAGDIGVGTREIAYLLGQYKRIENRVTGVFTGKGLSIGGSLVRTEAPGYGAVYFVQHMLENRGEGIRGRTAVVSGSGTVALYCIEKLIQVGAKVLTASDSDGFVYDPAGIDMEKLGWLMELKQVRRGRVREYAEHFAGVTYNEGQRPWGVACDLAIPCATQNELAREDAEALVKNGVRVVVEGANMPSTSDAVRTFLEHGVLFAPSKAASAGGVAVSGLEQSQNALRIPWSEEELDSRLQAIMKGIHDQCLHFGDDGDGGVNYVKGANLAAFVKVADAMLAYGVL